jgi:hypothetical protein
LTDVEKDRASGKYDEVTICCEPELLRDLLAALDAQEQENEGGAEAYRIQGEELLHHIRLAEAAEAALAALRGQPQEPKPYACVKCGETFETVGQVAAHDLFGPHARR